MKQSSSLNRPARLSHDQKRAIRSAFQEGKEPEEVADTVGVSRATAYRYRPKESSEDPGTRQQDERSDNEDDGTGQIPLDRKVRINVPLDFDSAEILDLHNRAKAQGFSSLAQYVG